jgi:membrane protein
VLTILASVGFNYYVNSISQYNSLYGSIGTLIIVMVWIFFNAMIVLIGYELNVSILNAKKKYRLIPIAKNRKPRKKA